MELTDLYPNIYKQLRIERAREEYFNLGLLTEEEYENKIKEIKAEPDVEFYEEG